MSDENEKKYVEDQNGWVDAKTGTEICAVRIQLDEVSFYHVWIVDFFLFPTRYMS